MVLTSLPAMLEDSRKTASDGRWVGSHWRPVCLPRPHCMPLVAPPAGAACGEGPGAGS